MKNQMDLEILSAKLGITKHELLLILKNMVLDDLNAQIKFYTETAGSKEYIKYLNEVFSEEDLFDKLSEELECSQD